MPFQTDELSQELHVPACLDDASVRRDAHPRMFLTPSFLGMLANIPIAFALACDSLVGCTFYLFDTQLKLG